MSFGSFENVINKVCSQIIYLVYMYKQDLELNSHKTKPNQTKPNQTKEIWF